MAESDLLVNYGLHRNPFTDRTAENTALDVSSFYMHSDLQGFSPSETTYLFFGKRGSGKTTIRMQMQKAYLTHNKKTEPASRGFFIIDLCTPSHLTACLRNFGQNLDISMDTWDSKISDSWTCDDLVDCILSYAATKLVDMLLNDEFANGSVSMHILGNQPANSENIKLRDKILANSKLTRQILVLIYIYAQTDKTTLKSVQTILLEKSQRNKISPVLQTVAAVTTVAVTGLVASKLASTHYPEQYDSLLEVLSNVNPSGNSYGSNLNSNNDSSTNVTLTLGTLTTMAVVGAIVYKIREKRKSARRARELMKNVRVVSSRDLCGILDVIFPTQDETVDEIRSMYIGVSPFQKLKSLSNLVAALGYEGLTVFGDCFDEVTLLDPVKYPGALKRFAREVCRNDFLSFGRLHFFFPDSRIALDLNTDQVLKEARFDRHFVRDLTWSRHQLADLAERRFKAAQMAEGLKGKELESAPGFQQLFEKVSKESFSSALSRIQTPRELMIMMTEVLARMEAKTENGFVVAAPDLEVAVQKAKEQAL